MAHLEPAAIPAYKAFVGDVSDNIPGIDYSPIKKQELIDIVAKHLNSIEKLKEFITDCQLGNKTKNLEKLSSVILEKKQLPQLKMNSKITELTYYSNPLVLIPNEDKLESILQRYSLRV